MSATLVRVGGLVLDADKVLIDLDKAEAAESLVAFIRMAWSIVEPGQPYTHGWHIDAICEHLEAITDGHELADGTLYNRLLVNVPPGTMKSLITNVFWPAWEWGPCNMPHLRYVCAAHKVENLSARDSRRMRQLITSEWYQARWGDLVKLAKDQNEKLNFVNSVGGFRIATAITSLTGIRGDRVICFPHDEIVHTENGPMKIGEIVNEKKNIRVWSSKPGSNKAELKNIYSWKKNPGSPIVEVGLSDGSVFKCTPDHKVWTNSGWIAASLLNSSHMLPGMSVFNGPDSSGSYSILSRQNPLRFFGLANNNSIIGCKDGTGGFFASEVVIFLSNVLSKLSPSFSPSNLLNGASFNAKFSGQFIGGRFAFCDDFGGVSGYFCPRPLFMKGESAMLFGVGNVFSPCAVFEVAKSCIASVSIFVSNFLSRFRFANKGKQNSLVDKNLLRYTIDAGVESRVSFGWRSFYNFTSNGERPPANSRNNSPFAPDAAKIAYAVKTLETGDRFPVFVREVGHAEDTFCLSVEDNHSFFVGSGKGVLVSNCDDPHSVDSAASETQRQAEVNNFLEAIPTRLNDPIRSSIVVIMQRLHEEDVSGVILDKRLGYDHLMLPMEFDPARAFPTKLGFIDPRTEAGELLFPERFPAEVVARDKKVMGPYATAGQFQQEPTPRGGGVIKREWWRLYEASVFPPMEYVVASLDTAYTIKAENDFSALTVWGLFSGAQAQRIDAYATRGGQRRDTQDAMNMFDQAAQVLHKGPEGPRGDQPRLMLMDGWQDRLELHDLVEKVAKTCRRLKVDLLLIENKAAGHSVAQEIRRLYNHEDWGVQMYDPKTLDKLARLYSIQHLFAEGIVYAPDRAFADMVIQQVSVFPKGKNDDIVDTVSMAVKHFRDRGLLIREPEWQAEMQESMRHQSPVTSSIYEV